MPKGTVGEQENNKTSKRSGNITNKKVYFGYYSRLVLFISIFIVLLGVGVFLCFFSFSVSKERKIYYKETSNLDYKVYLKENDFYETPYLDKNMSYVANLINNVNVDFQYDFIVNERFDLNFNYQVIGKLTIADSTGTSVYFQKDYTLLSPKEVQMIDQQNLRITEKVVIDYNYYNDLANRFKTSYGIDTTSRLEVYLKINYNNISQEVPLSGNSQMSINIPLSEKAINIKLNYKDISNSEEVMSHSSIVLGNIFYIFMGIVLILASFYFLMKLIKLLIMTRKKNNQYDKYIKRFLLEYDRMIVETSYLPNFSENNIIKIPNFNELLDVRDNLKLPIMYYNVTKHHKCHFFIKKDRDIYLTTIKDVDLEEKRNEKDL